MLRHRLHGTGDAMTDLRKAAEMAAYEVPLHELLEGVPENARLVIDSEDGMSTRFIPVGHFCKRAAKALRQALAQEEKSPVKSYCGGKPNYCTPEVTPEVTTEVTGDVGACVTCGAPKGEWLVDAVNMSQERVDETVKREHEPYGYLWFAHQMERRFTHYRPKEEQRIGEVTPIYTAPPKREWVGLTDDEIQETGQYSYCRGGTSEKLYHIMWNSQPSASVGWCREELIAFAHAVGAKLKEKNT